MFRVSNFEFRDCALAVDASRSLRSSRTRRSPRAGTTEFGKSFEHYLLMELMAYRAYAAPELDLCYWRTASGLEVDVVMGDMAIAVEFKGSARVHAGDGGGLRALREEHPVKHALVVCMERAPRKLTDGIEVWPWQLFLERLWTGDLI